MEGMRSPKFLRDHLGHCPALCLPTLRVVLEQDALNLRETAGLSAPHRQRFLNQSELRKRQPGLRGCQRICVYADGGSDATPRAVTRLCRYNATRHAATATILRLKRAVLLALLLGDSSSWFSARSRRSWYWHSLPSLARSSPSGHNVAALAGIS